MNSKRRFLAYTVAVFVGFAAIMIALLVHFIPLSYEEMARRDFGGPHRIATMTTWYELMEKRPAAAFIEISPDPEAFGFPKTRMIPAFMLPKEFANDLWSFSGKSPSMASAAWGSVFAHYDEEEKLRAIEFYGSRYGAFVSRDPALRPQMPGELIALSSGTLLIQARITGDPD